LITPSNSPKRSCADHRFEFAQHTNTYLVQTITTADAKVNLLLVVAIGLMAVLSSQYSGASPSSARHWAVLLALLAFAFSVACLLAAAWPRLNHAPQGYLFFGHLKGQTGEELYDALSSIDDDGLVRELALQNSALSLVAWRKFLAIRLAVAALAMGLVLAVVGLLA
jgi:hypothetical protein